MKLSILLAGILFPVITWSQAADSSIKNKLVTTSPALGGVNVSAMIAPLSGSKGDFEIYQTVVDAGIPVYKNFARRHPVFFKAGVRYQGMFLSGEKNIGRNNFHSFTIPLLYSYVISPSSNITFIGSASVNSDFQKDITGDDLIYSAGVRVGFRQNKSFKLGVTLAYINDYTGAYMIPVPDIDWSISKRLNLTAVLPARFSLKYRIDASQSFGITGGFNGNVYALNQGATKQYIQFQQYSGGLIYDLKLARDWKLNLIAARTFSQRLETFNRDQKVSFNGFGDLSDRIRNVSYRQNSFVFQGSISLQF